MDKTFSFKVKDELARLKLENLCCVRSELLGLLRAGAVLEVKQSGLQLIFTTESPSVVRRTFLLFKKISSLHIKISREPRRIHDHNLYSVRVDTQPGLKEFLIQLGFLKSDVYSEGTVMPRMECCRRSYLRGFFLGAGSITNPERSYHLELVTGNRRHATHLIRLCRGFDLRARRVERKDRQVVYLKEGDEIATFLTLIGAVTSRLEFENVRVIKGVRNQVNRLVNCETANLNKTVEAACRQLDAIRLLVAKMGLEGLPKPLREVARLRLEQPEATLKELGAQLNPPLGKSGVNHRLRKLEAMAAGLKEKGKKG
ncbi:MAG: DNA-binding protein WhiA [Firmicutes bacterium]|jgi:DNA-binding protein WhiA|nr:DNA-binding protein WhiA [Bacillota bacterium]